MISPSSVESFLDAVPFPAERRGEPRVAVDVSARIKSLSPLTSTGPSLRARILDISHSGMKVVSNRQFQVGALVQIITKESLYMGTVRHSTPVEQGFAIGVKLTEKIPCSLVWG